MALPLSPFFGTFFHSLSRKKFLRIFSLACYLCLFFCLHPMYSVLFYFVSCRARAASRGTWATTLEAALRSRRRRRRGRTSATNPELLHFSTATVSGPYKLIQTVFSVLSFSSVFLYSLTCYPYSLSSHCIFFLF